MRSVRVAVKIAYSLNTMEVTVDCVLENNRFVTRFQAGKVFNAHFTAVAAGPEPEILLAAVMRMEHRLQPSTLYSTHLSNYTNLVTKGSKNCLVYRLDFRYFFLRRWATDTQKGKAKYLLLVQHA